MQETQAGSLGQEDPLEEGMAKHSTILAWRIPWAEEPELQRIHGLRGSQAPRRAVCGTRGSQLEKTHVTPPSSRDEGLLFLHGLESNPESSLQTPQEA